MADAVVYDIQVRDAAQPLPPEVGDLLGHEAVERFDVRDTDTLVVGAVEDGVWVAALLLLIDEANGQKVGSIRQLVIPPAQRGRGLAGRLIRRALTVAAERGAVRLRSTAGWGCPDHRALYHRMKFDAAPADDAPYLVTRTVYPE